MTDLVREQAGESGCGGLSERADQLIGVDVEQYKGIPATYGLQYEGNILAAYCGALAVMMMTMYLQKRKRGYLMGYGVLGLAGMIISLSRGGHALITPSR